MHILTWELLTSFLHVFFEICQDGVLQVARCTKIINPGTDEAKYVINVKQIAKVG